jgi:signal transduction histidine kinase
LARRLIVKSVGRTANNQHERVEAYFDWTKLEPGKDLESFEVPISREVLSRRAKTGVTLVLEDVRDAWTEGDFASLQQDLLALVSPALPQEASSDTIEVYTSDRDPGFSIKFDSPEFPKYTGELIHQFYQGAWGIIRGQVTPEGKPSYTLEVPRTDEAIGPFSPDDHQFEHLAAVECQIRYFVYRADFFKGLEFGVTQARKVGQATGGVRIYLDGFRVFPYGDSGDDWLGLDSDRARNLTGTPSQLVGEAKGLRRPMLYMPGNYQLFGYVTLSKKNNPAIIPNISRERLVENEAYEELKRFVRLGINWATVQYARFVARQQQEKKPSSPFMELSDSINRATDLLQRYSGPLDIRMRSELEASLGIAKRALERQQVEQISELSMLRVLASAGTMVMVLDHTLRAMISGLGQVRNDLSQFESQIPDKSKNEYQDILGRLEEWKNSVEAQALQVGLLVGSSSRDRRRRVLLSPLVEGIRRGFLGYCQEFDINIANKVSSAVRTPPMFSSEVNAILINLVTNAIKAVRGREVRNIEISANREGNALWMWVKDTGIGVPERMRQEVFQPFVTTSAPDPVLGVGTGLGLKIVRDLVRSYGGEVHFAEPDSPWSTTVEIKFPGR